MNFDDYVLQLNSNLRVLKGVGEKKSALFAKLGINCIWDLLHYFPRDYEDRTVFYDICSAPAGEMCCIKAAVTRKVTEKRIKKNISLYILKAEDGTGAMSVKWFSSPFNKTKIIIGGKYVFYGYVSSGSAVKEMELKCLEPVGLNSATGRIVPVYALTAGLTQNDFKKAVAGAFELVGELADSMPENIILSRGLMRKNASVRQMHMPDSFALLKSAKRSLAFEELFTLTLALMKIRACSDIKTDIRVKNVKCAADFAKKLPFELTCDQKNVINEICADFLGSRPMNRLLQGDVGSGKTAVAAAAAYVMCKNGYQTALMAPTEILANQHFEALGKFFEGCGIRVGLLTGSVKNKQETVKKISDGYYDVAVGTHALIQDGVSFKNLGLCITDEQHRFGVRQRASLGSAAQGYPHVLVMSATPIPRTLSLIVYGDLDISVIKTLPSGRKPVETYLVNDSKRERMYGFMEKNIAEGGQCFVVCPLVEDSDKLDIKSSVEIQKKLSKVFPQYTVSLIHGKMSAAQKDAVMEDFRLRRSEILVATTVIEVGIDVPNANVIIIENAERFGLSQLHQLRGRVGRGNSKSYCILVSECETEECRERMSIMCRTNDGFEIAQKDLELRGCGEFFGTRQHGLPELKVANLFTDAETVKEAREACDEIIKSDPNLSDDSLNHIKARIEKLFSEFGNLEIFN